VLFITILLFSCTNDIKEIHDILEDKNLPIAIAENINLVYKDSGTITTKMRSPLLYDFSNRKNHPYSEFPKGIYITKIKENSDSTSIKGDYAISFSKTNISEIKGNVEVTNYGKNYKLTTSQLYWDQQLHYFFSEKKFTFITATDTLYGTGFESSENLTNWHVKNNSGSIQVTD